LKLLMSNQRWVLYPCLLLFPLWTWIPVV